MKSEASSLAGTLVVQAFGPDGKPKKIFRENRLFLWLLAKGYASPHFAKIPLLLGTWSSYKEIEL